jgi:energy-coupling factor transport system ATP-binding protein
LFFQLEQVTYRHPGLSPEASPAIKNVSLSIAEGEWVALVGANGSGKTTLARHLNGLLLPGSGRVIVDGLDTRIHVNLAKIRARVGIVFQSPEDQIVASLVGEDTAFGPENLAVPSGEVRSRIESALRTVGMWDLRDRAPHLLSAGQIQRVALAGVLAMQPKCILFDETTAMLDPLGKQDVLNQMRMLNQKGMTIIMITHTMDEAALANRAILLDHGHVAFDGPTEKLFCDEALLQHCSLEQPTAFRINNILGKAFPNLQSANFNSPIEKIILPEFMGNGVAKPARVSSETAGELVRVNDLGHTYMLRTPMASVALKDVNLIALKGITHGLVGATGSGKSTLLQHLNGLYLPQTGKVQVGQFDTTDPKVDLRALRRFAGVVFQNPELYFFEQYVGDEIAYGAKLFFGREGLRQRVMQAMQLAGLDFETFKDRMPNTLSGGEKRKAALAAALIVEPELLILDEPSAGLDPFSRQVLLKNLSKIQREGHSIVISSHNMEDIAALAQEMTIMQQGTSISSGGVGSQFSDLPLLKQAGLSQPAGALLASALRRKDWPISLGAVTLEQVEAELTGILSGGQA